MLSTWLDDTTRCRDTTLVAALRMPATTSVAYNPFPPLLHTSYTYPYTSLDTYSSCLLHIAPHTRSLSDVDWPSKVLQNNANNALRLPKLDVVSVFALHLPHTAGSFKSPTMRFPPVVSPLLTQSYPVLLYISYSLLRFVPAQSLTKI